MLLLWKQGSSYWVVGLAFAFLGAGVGLAGTPASHSLTGSVPIRRAGIASGPADLQRGLGGAIMQSILGALLTARYARAITRSVASAPHRGRITGSVQSQLEKSFAGAQEVAQRYPQYASKLTAAAKGAFLAGTSGPTRPPSSACCSGGAGVRPVPAPGSRGGAAGPLPRRGQQVDAEDWAG